MKKIVVLFVSMLVLATTASAGNYKPIQVSQLPQTAQQFINVKDIRDKYLYTRGGMVFIYLRIHAISIDLYSKSEKNVLIKTLTAELSDIQYQFKFMALSLSLIHI